MTRIGTRAAGTEKASEVIISSVEHSIVDQTAVRPVPDMAFYGGTDTFASNDPLSSCLGAGQVQVVQGIGGGTCLWSGSCQEPFLRSTVFSKETDPLRGSRPRAPIFF